MSSFVDFLAIGELSENQVAIVQLLLDIGKAPLGWKGEFSPVFYLRTSDPMRLPTGVSMYLAPSEELENWRKIIGPQSIVLLLKPTEALVNEVRSKTSHCCIMATDDTLFQGCQIINSSASLLDMIYKK